MKFIFPIIVVFISLIISCTKVIDLDLNNSDPQIVVEGNVGDSTLVRLTKSINFDQSNTFPPILNALVRITDNLGNIDTLIEKSEGNYSSSTLAGIQGRTYFLDLIADGKNYSSQSTIPSKISFDSLFVEKATSTSGRQGSTTTYKVTVRYSDPAGQSNYYRFREYINDELQSSNYIFDDRLTNGKEISTDLISNNRKLNVGDKLTIEMQCVDKSVYEYFNSYSNLGNGPQNATTPANPYTNITGGKLGYFNAHTTQKKSVIIP